MKHLNIYIFKHTSPISKPCEKYKEQLKIVTIYGKLGYTKQTMTS